jgi:ribosome maturation factor RimP
LFFKVPVTGPGVTASRADSAKHTGGRQPTFYFHPLIRWLYGESRWLQGPDGRSVLSRGYWVVGAWTDRERSTKRMAGGIDKIREIAERVAQSSGLELVDVELLGGGKARMLRVFIDKPGGVTHDDCSNFSREAGTIFDVEDAIPGGQYTLEVSSPGLDRKLSRPEEFHRFVGSLVKLMTRDPVNGNRHFEGRLKAFEDGRLSLELTARKKSKKQQEVEPGTAVDIDFRNVEKANLVPEF